MSRFTVDGVDGGEQARCVDASGWVPGRGHCGVLLGVVARPSFGRPTYMSWSLIAPFRSIDDPPDEIGIEFGVQLSAQTGAFIASAAAAANFRVSMTWRRGATET